MSIRTLDQIQRAIGAGARPNLYTLSFNGGIIAGDGSKLSLLVKAAALPASTLGVIEIPHIGGRRLKIAGDRSYADWTTTIINDGQYKVRGLLESYQKRFVNSSYALSSGGVGGRATEPKTTVAVSQLDQAGGVIASFALYDCFPSEIGAIDLSYDSTDVLEEFTVTWSFNYFTKVK